MKATHNIPFAAGDSVQVFDVDYKQEIFLRKRFFFLGVRFFHISRGALPDIEATARTAVEQASPTPLEYTHSLLAALLASFQAIALLLFFTGGAGFPLWHPTEAVAMGLIIGLAISIALRFGLAAMMRHLINEPFAVSLSRGVIPRAHRAPILVGETRFFPRYLIQRRNVTAHTYISASRRGLCVSRMTSHWSGFNVLHTWIARSDIDSFLRALGEAIDAAES